MELSNKGDKTRRIADAGVITLPASILGLNTNRATGAAGAATTVTLTAKSSFRWVVYGYHFSYDSAPAAGSTITLTRGTGGSAKVIEQQAVTSEGHGPVTLPIPLHGAENEQMEGVLSAPGGAIVGRLTLFAQLIPG